MTIGIRLTLPLAAVLVLLITAGCASSDRVDTLEQDIRVMQTQVSRQVQQQQSTEASVTEQLAGINESVASIDEKLMELEATASELSDADGEIEAQLSDLKSRLDERAINRIFMMPLTYAVIISVLIAVLLLGTMIGFWGHHWKSHREQPSPELEE